MSRMSEHLINTAEQMADEVCARLATGDCSDEAIWAAIRELGDARRFDRRPFSRTMRELIFETITMRRAR